MRSWARGAAALLLAASLHPAAGQAASGQAGSGQAASGQAPAAAADPMPAASPEATPVVAPDQPCGARAARFENGKGFSMVITRSGQVQTTNPLRPLTTEVNAVLQVVIAGKVATAYGPDLSTLRRGSAPSAVEAMLGGAIKWQPSLPTLPDSITIVSEEGTPLAQLAFRACEAPPNVKAPPKVQARKKAPARPAVPKAAAEKTPPGFSMPQGAIAE